MKFPFYDNKKPRKFEYIPRYYDPEEEAREKRRIEILGPDYRENYKTSEEKAAERKFASGEEYKPGQYIGQMRIRRGIIADRRAREKKRIGTLRLIIVLLLLVWVALWLWG